MVKRKLQPDRDLLQRVTEAFLAHGYAGLSMVGLAKACGFTQRALYYYFSNKDEAFRATIASRNAENIELGMAAGEAVRTSGGNALDIFAAILDVRYGETRRRLNVSPHTIELNAEAFKRARASMIDSAVDFQNRLERLILEFEAAGMLKLNGRFSAAAIAQGLADGGRAVNQSLPPIPSADFPGRYRQMCAMVMYGSLERPEDEN